LSLVTSAATNYWHVQSKSPLGSLQILCGRANHTLICWQIVHQTLGGIGSVGIVLSLNPFGVGIASSRFVFEPEPAFCRALEMGLEESRRNPHAEISLSPTNFGEYFLARCFGVRGLDPRDQPHNLFKRCGGWLWQA